MSRTHAIDCGRRFAATAGTAVLWPLHPQDC
jgi:hypothetical protein